MKVGRLLFIPTYNCSAQVERLIAKLNSNILAPFTEVIFLDNQSSDDTLSRARYALAARKFQNVQVWQNETNIGLGGSFKRALRYAIEKKYLWIMVLHGDDQADPSDILKLFEASEKAPTVAAVLGSRFTKDSVRQGYSLIRTVGNIALNLIFSGLMGRRISDIGSGLNLYSVEALVAAEALKSADHIAFDAQILLRLLDSQRAVIFAAIKWSQSDQQTNAKNFEVGFEALKILLKYKFNPEVY